MKNALLLEFRKRTLDQSRKAGIPAYFLDDAGQGVIRVLPDGRKERILMQQGRPQVEKVECRC